MRSPNPEPASLLRLARVGGNAALGELLELYRPYLTLLARVQIGQRLQGKADPADLVQETFLRAYRGFGQFRGMTEAAVVAWLRQILASCLADLMRRCLGTRRRFAGLEQELADELDRSSRCLHPALVAKDSSPSRQAVRREQAVLLADALERLPADYRDVLVLRHLEELSFPEVARRMGRSLDSVEKLWARALRRLRRLMGDAP